MSLDNIQLSPLLVQDLFRNSLIQSGPDKAPAAGSSTSEKGFLGNNKKGVAILVNAPGCSYLPEDDLNFLVGILTACQLSLNDVALLNLANTAAQDYAAVNQLLNPSKIFLFGIEPASLQLPLVFPHYQVQQYNGQVFLAAPALEQLRDDKAEKMKLWNCLKSVFQIS